MQIAVTMSIAYSFRPLSRGLFFNNGKKVTLIYGGVMFSSPFSRTFFQFEDFVKEWEKKIGEFSSPFSRTFFQSDVSRIIRDAEMDTVFVPFLEDFFSIKVSFFNGTGYEGFSSPFSRTFFQ